MLTRYISVRCVAFTLHFLFRYFSQGEMGEMACKDLPERQVSVDIFPTVHETKLGYHIWKKKKNIQSGIHDNNDDNNNHPSFQCHVIQKRSK